MKKSSLVVLNIGFLLIMLSAMGEGMEINYLITITGATITGVGAIMFFRTKNKPLPNEEK